MHIVKHTACHTQCSKTGTILCLWIHEHDGILVCFSSTQNHKNTWFRFLFFSCTILYPFKFDGKSLTSVMIQYNQWLQVWELSDLQNSKQQTMRLLWWKSGAETWSNVSRILPIHCNELTIGPWHNMHSTEICSGCSGSDPVKPLIMCSKIWHGNSPKRSHCNHKNVLS